MNEIEHILSRIEFDQASGQPVAVEVANGFCRLIDSGELQPGQRLPATGKLARLIGVSRQVAHDALAQLARQGRVHRKQRLGTVVAGPATHRTVGLLTLVDPGLPLQANFGWVIAQDFLEVVEARGYDHREYMIRKDLNRRALSENLVQDLHDGRIDVMLVGAVYREIVEQFAGPTTVPVLQLGGSAGGWQAVEDAVRWLWQQGCTGLALALEAATEATPLDESYATNPRTFEESFVANATGLNLPVRPEWILRGMRSTFGQGREVFHRLFDTAPGPDGLIIMDDMVAYGLLGEAAKCGRALDESRVVIMTNKGSALPLPAACPKVELDWSAVLHNKFDEIDALLQAGAAAGEQHTVLRFRVPVEADAPFDESVSLVLW